MRIDVLSLFPEVFASVVEISMWKKARENGLFLCLWNIRDFSRSKQYKVDSPPFGGGAGMVLRVEPVFSAIEMLKSDTTSVVELTPRGRVFNQRMAKEFSSKEHIILLCGHYEGIDERVSNVVDERISIGDFIVTGGEVPAMLFIESVMRLIPGVLGNDASAQNESFSKNILEHPHYTRPRVYQGEFVPEELLNGDHQTIARWREESAYKHTKKYRPDLLKDIRPLE